MFFKKKPPVNSDEYEQLNKKIVALVADVDVVNNKLALLDGIVKSNRARINKIKIEEITQEGEKLNKDDPVYLG